METEKAEEISRKIKHMGNDFKKAKKIKLEAVKKRGEAEQAQEQTGSEMGGIMCPFSQDEAEKGEPRSTATGKIPGRNRQSNILCPDEQPPGNEQENVHKPNVDTEEQAIEVWILGNNDEDDEDNSFIHSFKTWNKIYKDKPPKGNTFFPISGLPMRLVPMTLPDLEFRLQSTPENVLFVSLFTMNNNESFGVSCRYMDTLLTNDVPDRNMFLVGKISKMRSQGPGIEEKVMKYVSRGVKYHEICLKENTNVDTLIFEVVEEAKQVWKLRN